MTPRGKTDKRCRAISPFICHFRVEERKQYGKRCEKIWGKTSQKKHKVDSFFQKRIESYCSAVLVTCGRINGYLQGCLSLYYVLLECSYTRQCSMEK